MTRARNMALVAAAIGLALGGAGLAMGATGFFASYLVAYVLCWGLAGGSLALLLLHHLTGGGWGFSIQRLLEAAVKTLPLIAVLFVPVLLGLHDLYHWTHAEAVEQDAILSHKAIYLNVPFFLARAGAYFAVWIAIGFLLTRMKNVDGLRRIAGPGLVVYVLTTTFAGFDWVMSIDPHWFSTIFGLIVVVAQALSALSFAILVFTFLRTSDAELGRFGTVDRMHDLGKLLFAFVMLWGYVNFSQLIIIWYGNLPEEIVWYVHRIENGWRPITLFVVAVTFVLPFFGLLSRRPKRNPRALRAIAIALIASVWLAWFWLIVPGALRHHIAFSIHDLAWPLCLGGLWVAAFFHLLRSRPLLPSEDPRLEEMSSHGH